MNKKDLAKQLNRASKALSPAIAAFRVHTVEASRVNIPFAYNRIMKHSAQMHFQRLANCQGRAFEERKNIIRDKLTQAGYDVKADKPYKEVLGLEGGRRAFNAIRPK
jgi:hypothetical protein